MTYESAFEAGSTFSSFLRDADAHRELWQAFAERARPFEDAAARIERVGGCWRLLVLADDWCGDAVNTLPVIARLAEESPHLELRIVPRDRFPELRDRHLTNGSRSIPIVIPLDGEGRPRGSWGPRPAELQARFDAELRALSKEGRYREIRRWYARDRGAATAHEIAGMIERAAGEGRGSRLIPCREQRAA